MKLELGAGPDRQTPGYAHNDVNAFEGIDYIGNAWELELPSGSLEEVIALSFMEHLTYLEFAATLTNVRRMLKPGGLFLFDVPDLETWCRHFINASPFDRAYVLRTLYGWQRWEGDEHRSGWTPELLEDYVGKAFEYCAIETTAIEFRIRGIFRYRFTTPEDAHFYVRCQ